MFSLWPDELDQNLAYYVISGGGGQTGELSSNYFLGDPARGGRLPDWKTKVSL